MNPFTVLVLVIFTITDMIKKRDWVGLGIALSIIGCIGYTIIGFFKLIAGLF